MNKLTWTASVLLCVVSLSLVALAHPRPQIFFPGATSNDGDRNHDKGSLNESDQPDDGKLQGTNSGVDRGNDKAGGDGDDSPVSGNTPAQVDHKEGDQDEANQGDREENVPECDIFSNSLLVPDPETGEEKCYEITSQGPCQTDEWFVLDTVPDENGQARGICRPRPCLPNHVMFAGVCYLLESLSPCPRGSELLANPFGEGQCECMVDFIPHQLVDQPVQCFQPFLQGPCQAGEQLVEADGIDSIAPSSVCRPHNCPLQDQIRWEDGKCYESIQCAVNERVRLESKSKDDGDEDARDNARLICDDLAVRQLLVLPGTCPEGQSLNHDGECKEVVDFSGGRSRPRRRLATGNLGMSGFLAQRFQR